MFNIDFVQKIISYNWFGINWTDIVILIVIWFYVVEGYDVGFTLAAFDFVSFVVSFLLALRLYNLAAHLLLDFFPLPLGLSNAIGFFLIALIAEVVMSILLRRFVYPRLPLPLTTKGVKIYHITDHILGMLPGLASGLVVIAFLLTLILSLPVSPFLKDMVTHSLLGSRIVIFTTNFEGKLGTIFGGALQDTMSYLTIEPQSNESINLHFTVNNGSVDKSAEKVMLADVNQQRNLHGDSSLQEDDSLTKLAERYANNMFIHGYFSHYDQNGLSPFERMNNAGINYTSAGENLALAANVDLAMQGLMNSPGHRANILSTSFHKVGIGVVNGGIYGEMFVQEFTN